jgi:hypothetical protein
MSEATPQPVPVATPQPAAPLQLVGSPDAEACVGEFCALPAHREHAVMNRRVDSDLI